MYPKNPFLIKGVGGKISLLYNSSKGNGRGIMKELEAAIELREKGQLEKSNEILVNLVKKFPNCPMVNYQCAWSFDALGLEKEAIQYYERAISIGLPDEDMQNALIGLGSTYRVLGDYKKSRDVLEKAIKEFPDNIAMKVFYAMTLYNLNEYSRAMEILLNCLAKTSSDETIKKYRKAIEFYSDKLDQVW